jgi:CubicO group peptidase (beta-lactamase class C family)
MLRELLPQIEGFPIGTVPDSLPGGVNPRAQLSAGFYIDYVNQNVFGPAGVPGLRNCKPTTNSLLKMLSYPSPPTTSSGTDWGDFTLQCGAGGWNMSANDLTLVFNSLVSGSLLTPAQQTQLYTGGGSMYPGTGAGSMYPGLGWDNTVNNCPGAYQNGQTYYWCKNGGNTDNSGNTIGTFAGVFKCNTVPVVVIVNSPTQAITPLVTSAFSNPTTKASGSPQPCPTGKGGG